MTHYHQWSYWRSYYNIWIRDCLKCAAGEYKARLTREELQRAIRTDMPDVY